VLRKVQVKYYLPNSDSSFFSDECELERTKSIDRNIEYWHGFVIFFVVFHWACYLGYFVIDVVYLSNITDTSLHDEPPLLYYSSVVYAALNLFCFFLYLQIVYFCCYFYLGTIRRLTRDYLQADSLLRNLIEHQKELVVAIEEKKQSLTTKDTKNQNDTMDDIQFLHMLLLKKDDSINKADGYMKWVESYVSTEFVPLYSMYDRLYLFQLFILFVDCFGFAIDLAVLAQKSTRSYLLKPEFEFYTDIGLIVCDIWLGIIILRAVNLKEFFGRTLRSQGVICTHYSQLYFYEKRNFGDMPETKRKSSEVFL